MSGYAKCCADEPVGLCCLCDTLYCYGHRGEHDHPEPQSGDFRDAWLKSGMPYFEWSVLTPLGRAWVEQTEK